MSYTLKRKRGQQQDSDDDEPSFGKQILPVANLPDDFDGEPMDGMQYLFTVRRDARQLPLVTRVANPFEIPEESIILSPSGSLRPTHPALPSEEWRKSFENRFRNFRKNVIQPTIHIHLPQDPKHRLIPDKMKRDCWWAFLAGRPESEWNPPKRPKPLPTPLGSPAPSELSVKKESGCSPQPTPEHEHPSQTFKQREPTPTLAAYLDHRTSLHLLMYFVYWINVHLGESENSTFRITETHARWIFVLLSRVEDHISADDMSLLRNLARASLALLKGLLAKRATHTQTPDTCETAREEDTGGDEVYISERSCWIIVTAVTGIWGQRDLWMDAEDMLAGLSV